MRCVPAGPEITATLVVDALHALLPAELPFRISDRGTHVTAHEFARFAAAQGFVHVLIVRHRLESNGIAERLARSRGGWSRRHGKAPPNSIRFCVASSRSTSRGPIRTWASPACPLTSLRDASGCCSPRRRRPRASLAGWGPK